ncbi:MAG: hypothetical protein KGL69_01935 [Alphaproteobacteria bacterium]|jgi:hypothetical protein|nr:hypothetical protein [Alphaproteobacteria bacterium]
MKTFSLAASLVVAGLMAGAAAAQTMAPQATMQPIPNPPEKTAPHKMAHHPKKAKKADAAAPAPAKS